MISRSAPWGHSASVLNLTRNEPIDTTALGLNEQTDRVRSDDLARRAPMSATITGDLNGALLIRRHGERKAIVSERRSGETEDGDEEEEGFLHLMVRVVFLFCSVAHDFTMQLLVSRLPPVFNRIQKVHLRLCFGRGSCFCFHAIRR